MKKSLLIPTESFDKERTLIGRLVQEQLLSTKEAGKLVDISYQTVDRLIDLNSGTAPFKLNVLKLLTAMVSNSYPITKESKVLLMEIVDSNHNDLMYAQLKVLVHNHLKDATRLDVRDSQV